MTKTKTKYNWYFSQWLKRDENVKEGLMEKKSNQNYSFLNFFNIINKIKYMIHIKTVKSVSELYIQT